MLIKYPEIGICGLSCRLCPMYHTQGKSKCNGCKSKFRMTVGCPFITCALKKKGIEFCWDCGESDSCDKWNHHRTFSKEFDTFKCYQKLEENILSIQTNGVNAFEDEQREREQLLIIMLQNFNDGRSKSYYCIASTILRIDELKEALDRTTLNSTGLDIKNKSKILHAQLDMIAERQNSLLKLRKVPK